ncbi:MAG TPA: monofunctional biosynthetic peptidoglycan transglycosylase [Flavitalea sp.]|nr:monofunctional biosynthetic peptidoglycan transglycosylase [Flavitalea sp.]
MAKKKGFFPALLRFLKRLFIFLFVFQFFYIILLKWVDPPITLTQFGSLLSGRGLKRDYVDLNEMSPYAKLAMISAEDQLFPDHNGFDWRNIRKAMEYNKKKPGRVTVRGASTISQQVAKNVFLWQGKSYLRKGMEAYFTFMIELVWGKKRILEMYLNVSEMGSGIFGIQAASVKIYRRKAKQLTRQEAAMIAASMRNPRKFTVKPLSHEVAVRYPWVMRQMHNLEDDPDVQRLIQ